MIPMRRWTWQTWATLALAGAILAGQIPDILDARKQRQIERARLMLPTTADLFHVSYVTLDRRNGHLVVYTDAHAQKAFTGRFRVALRDRETFRHAWTPEWSGWIDYAANPGGSRYNQPETLQWWAGLEDDDFIEPPAGAWVMETCWQALYRDPALGPVELEPVCVPSQIALPEQTINEVDQ